MERIAIIDRDPNYYHELLTDPLFRARYTCQGKFKSVSQFVQSIESTDFYDLVLLSLDTGSAKMVIGHLYKLKYLLPDTKLIAVTSAVDRIVLLSALEEGINGYVVKPQTTKDLLSVLDQVSDQSYHLDQRAFAPIMQFFRQGGLFGGPSLDPQKRRQLQSLAVLELQVLDQLLSRNRYKQIADQLDISDNTARYYIRKVYQRFGVSKRSELQRLFGRTHPQKSKRTSY